MVRPEIKQATALQRKPHVPDSDRTAARDEVADWIEAEIINGERAWPETTISQIASTIGCSREHVARVLDLYFDPRGSGHDPLREMLAAQLDVDASSDDYRAGYGDGFTAGIQFALEHPTLVGRNRADAPEQL